MLGGNADGTQRRVGGVQLEEVGAGGEVDVGNLRAADIDRLHGRTGREVKPSERRKDTEEIGQLGERPQVELGKLRVTQLYHLQAVAAVDVNPLQRHVDAVQFFQLRQSVEVEGSDGIAAADEGLQLRKHLDATQRLDAFLVAGHLLHCAPFGRGTQRASEHPLGVAAMEQVGAERTVGHHGIDGRLALPTVRGAGGDQQQGCQQYPAGANQVSHIIMC